MNDNMLWTGISTKNRHNAIFVSINLKKMGQTDKLTNSNAYGTGKINVAFTSALQ